MAAPKPSLDERAQAELPLTPVALQILLALADQHRHGLGIAEEIEHTTGGKMAPGPGTLYGAIKRLLESGLIAEPDDTPKGQSDDPRRRYYHITPLGTRTLELETRALANVLQVAKAKRVL
jgi:DNA-binding PadR family transcriptional regulator